MKCDTPSSSPMRSFRCLSLALSGLHVGDEQPGPAPGPGLLDLPPLLVLLGLDIGEDDPGADLVGHLVGLTGKLQLRQDVAVRLLHGSVPFERETSKLRQERRRGQRRRAVAQREVTVTAVTIESPSRRYRPTSRAEAGSCRSRASSRLRPSAPWSPTVISASLKSMYRLTRARRAL